MRRREYLSAVGTGVTVGFAGCGDLAGADDPEDPGAEAPEIGDSGNHQTDRGSDSVCEKINTQNWSPFSDQEEEEKRALIVQEDAKIVDPEDVADGITEVSRGKTSFYSEIEVDGMIYAKESFINGIFCGHSFNIALYDEEDNPVIVLDNELDPEDGIMDVHMIPSFEESDEGIEFVTRIYVDEDFIETVGDAIQVAWGENFSNIRPFSFQEVDSGIYRDIVREPADRFELGKEYTSVDTAVGKFTKDDLRNGEGAFVGIILE